MTMKINLGTKFLTKQLTTGVGMAENLIGQVSKNVQDKVVPNAEPAKINKGLHVTARGLRSTSGVAVKASNYVGEQWKYFHSSRFYTTFVCSSIQSW